MKGSFITFEGGEGAGKTTILQSMEQYLVEKNYDVISTREPGGIEIAENIRAIILDQNNIKMDKKTEVLLYAAARRQHLVERVIPALQKGQVVLCDRFIDSSLAYQGYARGIEVEDILSINSFAIENVMPDLTIYFDVRPEVGLTRIQGDANREINRLDLEKKEFHDKVYKGYQKLTQQFPNRIKVINAEENLDVVMENTKKILDQLLD